MLHHRPAILGFNCLHYSHFLKIGLLCIQCSVFRHACMSEDHIIIDGCEPLSVCWELNSWPLWEQPVLLHLSHLSTHIAIIFSIGDHTKVLHSNISSLIYFSKPINFFILMILKFSLYKNSESFYLLPFSD